MILSATAAECMPASLAINPLYTKPDNGFTVSFHQSGVGMLATAVALTRLVLGEKPDLVIQAGIAGSFDPTIPLAKVMVVNEECIADQGVMEGGQWKDIFDMNLEQSSQPPYEERMLPNPWLETYNVLHLPVVAAVTVNQVTTDASFKQLLLLKYHPALESMEGAALHYVCRLCNIPFVQLRAVSNYVGERDKSQWKITEAIAALNQTLLQFVDMLYTTKSTSA